MKAHLSATYLNHLSFLAQMAKKTKKEDYAEKLSIPSEETEEEVEEEMEEGKKDTDVYSKEGLDVLEKDDEIEPWEEGFMEGAEDDGQLGKDALTGKPLMDKEGVYELKREGKLYRFLNQENAEEFKKRKDAEEVKGTGKRKKIK